MDVTNDSFKIFKNKKVLLTGDSGFKGSWLAIWLLELGAEVFGYSLPAKTRQDNFVRTDLQSKIKHVDGDIRNYSLLFSFFSEVKPDIAIHMAAQPLVLESYKDPVTSFETNMMGTVNFFECVRNTPSVKSAINVTSDKCYDNKEWVWGYRENDPMGGKDPYSASKGCSELITASYLNSYFLDSNTCNVASARAGNVIGGGDWAENRIIPDFYRALSKNEALVLRNPKATRPWQFVLEPLKGYLMLCAQLYSTYGTSKKYQGGWNFGPEDLNNVSVKELIAGLISHSQKGQWVEPANNPEYKEASLLKLDISKAKKELHWSPSLDLQETIEFTAEGYHEEMNESSSLYQARVVQIQKYSQKEK